MSILTEEEIEKLKGTHPKKRILRILFLLFGTVLILAGIVCLFLGVDFGIEISGLNASFLVDIHKHHFSKQCKRTQSAREGSRPIAAMNQLLRLSPCVMFIGYFVNHPLSILRTTNNQGLQDQNIAPDHRSDSIDNIVDLPWLMIGLISRHPL